jgi:hypothetical protein
MGVKLSWVDLKETQVHRALTAILDKSLVQVKPPPQLLCANRKLASPKPTSREARMVGSAHLVERLSSGVSFARQVLSLRACDPTVCLCTL